MSGADEISNDMTMGFVGREDEERTKQPRIQRDEGQGHAASEADVPAGVPQPDRRHDRLPLADAGADPRRSSIWKCVASASSLPSRTSCSTSTSRRRTCWASAGYDHTYGARPLRRIIQNLIEDPLAEGLLTGRFLPGPHRSRHGGRRPAQAGRSIRNWRPSRPLSTSRCVGERGRYCTPHVPSVWTITCHHRGSRHHSRKDGTCRKREQPGSVSSAAPSARATSGSAPAAAVAHHGRDDRGAVAQQSIPAASGTAPDLHAARDRSGSTSSPHSGAHHGTGRVLGGGLVPGSLVLLGGDPGSASRRSSFRPQCLLGCQISPVVYVSAEESAQQIKLRADRLRVDRTSARPVRNPPRHDPGEPRRHQPCTAVSTRSRP